MRAAAILEKRHIYVFDLDSEPASCNVYPLLPQDNFKVLLHNQPAGPTISDQQEVLITVPGAASLHLSPLTAWLEASSNNTPPLRITESMVAVEQLSGILPRQYSVLHCLHRRGVFQDDGWSQLVQAHIALAESPGVSAA